MDGKAMQELPRYQCHKKVWALKIQQIEVRTSGFISDPSAMAIITPAEEGYAPFPVDQEYFMKHLARMKPEQILGGYYVVYDDGYKSFSPAAAFENGYVRI